jgi:hypothetical protein
MEEYLTTKELSKRIKMSPGTIRNLVWRGVLQLNVHYVKPTPGKLLFIWSRIQKWLQGRSIRDTIKSYRTRENEKYLIRI